MMSGQNSPLPSTSVQHPAASSFFVKNASMSFRAGFDEAISFAFICTWLQPWITVYLPLGSPKMHPFATLINLANSNNIGLQNCMLPGGGACCWNGTGDWGGDKLQLLEVSATSLLNSNDSHLDGSCSVPWIWIFLGLNELALSHPSTQHHMATFISIFFVAFRTFQSIGK